MNKIILPELGDGIESATVACWHFKQGDEIKDDVDVVEVVTDKASFNVPAAGAGRLGEIFIQEGQEAKVGQALALIEPSHQ